MNESRLNLEDIAKKAGVSRSTVSRVINKEPYVSAKTRTRVMEVIEQESFRPNPAARMLVTQRTHIIGMVVPQISNVFFADNSYFPMLLQGASSAINEHDHSMLLWLQQDGENREQFSQRIARNRLMDGMVLCSIIESDPIVEMALETGMTFVTVERPIGFANKVSDQFSYVTVDNVHAANMAVEHLIRLGRKRIAHITGHLTIADGQDRLQGYRQAILRAGMPLDENLIFPGFFTREYGYLGMKTLLKYKPDAVFAGGDTTAQGALQAIHEAGLRVPDDIAIVGFDDLDIATQMTPKLTTIRQPVQQKGATAASLLIDKIEGRANGPQRVILPTELVIRQSCGAIPS
ncbi:MAG: LacI family DNA-binding transcriptional regulator [Chloroflexota bacterium]